MVVWSSFRIGALTKGNVIRSLFSGTKNASNRKGDIDMLVLYFYMGCIPIGLIVAYCNIFIGSAQLREIPEGYQPKHWEYYEHPIERFFAKYVTFSPQELHERNMHTLFLQNEKTMIRKLEAKVQNLVKERQDFQAWYFEGANTKYVRQFEHEAETKMRAGRSFDTLY
ncbi:hypothetical protein RUM43_012701 [Polyplax serrata]|uniref:NADH dehydrogenase [ubiquinone] 1 beta subcomplex subunit 5, mitochondrial n=1 Tax=Polyplax serrata TaxID=468196 RepID=A0AAN8PJG9_POLSC